MRTFQRRSLYGVGRTEAGSAPRLLTRFNSVNAVESTGIDVASFCFSYEKKKKVGWWPLLMGPPIEPPYCLRLKGGLDLIAVLLGETSAAFNFRSRRKKKAEPWN